MADVPVDGRWEVEALHQAADLLVMPMMAMLLRPMATCNDSLPFEHLHYLWLAARQAGADCVGDG